MLRKLILLFLLLGLFLFICIKPVFAYTSNELTNYVNHVCIVRIINPYNVFTPYISFKGKVLDIWQDKQGISFISIELKNEIANIPVEFVANIRYENTTEI